MALYSTGTVTVTNGSKTVNGSGTAWFGALQAGWMFIGPDGRTIGIENVVDNDTLTLTKPYLGPGAANQEYECFPTMSLAGDLAQAFQAIHGEFQGMVDTAGAGKFQPGTEAAPGISFVPSPSSGLRFASNPHKVTLVAGGGDRLSVSGNEATGSVVQSGKYDALLTRLMKVGAFGIGHKNTDMDLTADLNAWRTSGFIRYGSTTAGSPSAGAGVVMHLERLAGNGDGFGIQIAYAYNGPIYRRLSKPDGTWADWVEVIQSGGKPAFDEVELGGNVISGKKIVIATDAFASIVPPRKGGWMTLSTIWNDDYPDDTRSALIYYDVGTSLAVSKADLGASIGSQVAVLTTDVTGTTGATPKINVAVQPNAIKIENRSGSAKDFFVSFI